MEVHRGQAAQLRDYRTATGSDHDLVCSDRFGRANIQLPQPDKACPRLENGDIVALLAIGPSFGSLGINPAEDPISDLSPPHIGKV